MLLKTFSLTHLNFLISLPSTAIKEYILDFNRTNSLTVLPLNLSFILPITFLLKISKNFESCGKSLKTSKFLSQKKSL